MRRDEQGKTGQCPYEVGRKRNQRLPPRGGVFFHDMPDSADFCVVQTRCSSLWPVPPGLLPVGRGAGREKEVVDAFIGLALK